MIYTNGYIVKDINDNEDLIIKDDIYRGLETYYSWPLEKKDDIVSRELTRLAEASFEENSLEGNFYYEILTDVELLKRYVNHCNELQIEIIIMRVMTNKNAFIANEELNETEVLGYDCIAGYAYSYLSDIHVESQNDFAQNDFASYKTLKDKTNSNGLLNTYDEVEDFIVKRNKLLEQGINLEDYWEPVPARLSLVEI